LGAGVAEAERRGNEPFQPSFNRGVVTNPSVDSDLSYFRFKGELETFIRGVGISYAILRPTLLFGHGDILINNIAWILRHFPLFGMPGRGQYRLQPVFVEDFAALVVKSIEDNASTAVDALGPEIFTFRELLEMMKGILKSRCLIVPLPPIAAWAAPKLIGTFLGDVVLTRDEVKGLMRNLLVSGEPPTCGTRHGNSFRRASS
jgi:NADH dehydrogenase